MKLKQKLAVALFAATSICGLSSAAFAGEGGAAGAAAFTINAGAVTGVAVAASVGKQDAAAAAFNVPDVTAVGAGGVQNYAYALGSAGVITMTDIAETDATNIAGGADPALGTAQGNLLTVTPEIQIGTTSGNPIVTYP
ncbi:hypothetical protein AMR41_14580 [Hapalosiphon sp. MRB220]|nr:hypothetical protein AMR41_14580 [Hapalosiphon sp. MRB220]